MSDELEFLYEQNGNRVYRRKNGSLAVQVINDEPSLTQQHHRDLCDVNNILKKFMKTGIDVFANRVNSGFYGDFTNVGDYQDCLMKVMHAQEAFDSLPAEIRKEFQNDPGQFVDFVGNPDNKDRLVEMGLLPKESGQELTEKTEAESPAPSST